MRDKKAVKLLAKLNNLNKYRYTWTFYPLERKYLATEWEGHKIIHMTDFYDHPYNALLDIEEYINSKV